ncbi:hypothetical protein DSL72_008082 [Monilinia vaccinii-corymbosi]|uniref:Uncharacterized protein n=1 Tax=Monilinia vaccinii-corymbosi TaxID=61207 RepID=A0A8A3PJM8_9HELO|nr:hypothetical protein DSL72_008082 [Monilinia vaccinii-corymbosi]
MSEHFTMAVTKQPSFQMLTVKLTLGPIMRSRSRRVTSMTATRAASVSGASGDMRGLLSHGATVHVRL